MQTMNPEMRDLYCHQLEQYVRLAKPLIVVFDASNGPAGVVLEELATRLPDMKSIIINTDVDPDFSAHGPDPLAVGASDDCAARIKEHNADFGVIFDVSQGSALKAMPTIVNF